MPRYFIDTNCLLGLTFFHDRWYRDVKPLYENNRLYISEAVLHEYCNRGDGDPPMPDNPSSEAITTDAEAGKYADIRTDLEQKLPDFDREIKRLTLEGLTIEGVIETVIDHFEIREQAEAQVEEFIRDYFEDRALVERQAKAAVRKLVDRILYTSEKNKDALLSELRLTDSHYHTMQETREDIEYATDGWIQEADFCILLDGIKLAQSAGVERMVTGDAGYLHAEEVTASRYGLALVWAENEFYTDDFTYSQKEAEAALRGPINQTD